MIKQLLLILFIFGTVFQASAQITQNPVAAEKYQDHRMYFDYQSINEWLQQTETLPVDRAAESLSVLLVSMRANFERMRICNTRFTENVHFFKLGLSAPAQKALVHFARKAMEEIDSFPFGLASFIMHQDTKQFSISSLFMCVDFDFDSQDMTDQALKDLNKTNPYMTLLPCLKKFSSIDSASAEVQNRKIQSLVGLYRMLMILGCSEIENPARSSDPEYREDAKVLIDLVRKDIDLRDSDVGVQMKHWLGFR